MGCLGDQMSRIPLVAARRAAPLVVVGLWGVLGLAGGTAGAAVGTGATTTFTTSTSSHSTFTRVDLAPVQANQTRVTAVLGGVIVFDETVGDAPGSGAVLALEEEATSKLQAAGAGAISGPTLVESHQVADTAYLGDQVTGTPQTTTTTSAIGPQTILVGEEGSQSFFVPAGTVNFNTNTHTETLVNQTYQATVTDVTHVQLNAVAPHALAFTGSSDTGWLLAAGMLSLAIGVALQLASRTRLR